MNLPNILTLSRFLMAFFFAMAAQTAGLWGAALTLAFFVLASLTDWLDGYLARKYQQVTVFGQIMDPIADKALTLTAFFIFALEGTILMWMVILVAVRECVVTMMRVYALTAGRVLPAESAGKLKTIFQMLTIVLILLLRVAAAFVPTQGFVKSYQFYLSFLVNGFMIMTLFLTLWSGVGFLKNWFRKE